MRCDLPELARQRESSEAPVLDRPVESCPLIQSERGCQAVLFPRGGGGVEATFLKICNRTSQAKVLLTAGGKPVGIDSGKIDRLFVYSRGAKTHDQCDGSAKV